MRSGSPSLHRSSLSIQGGKRRAKAAFPEESPARGKYSFRSPSRFLPALRRGRPSARASDSKLRSGGWGGRKAAATLQSSERQARLSAQRGRVQLPGRTLGGGVAHRTAASPVDGEQLEGRRTEAYWGT